jgi:hypothetical protein
MQRIEVASVRLRGIARARLFRKGEPPADFSRAIGSTSSSCRNNSAKIGKRLIKFGCPAAWPAPKFLLPLRRLSY